MVRITQRRQAPQVFGVISDSVEIERLIELHGITFWVTYFRTAREPVCIVRRRPGSERKRIHRKSSVDVQITKVGVALDRVHKSCQTKRHAN